MTDYSNWEVIKNGNKVLKRTVRTVEQIYEPTFVEEKLDRKNEMKARGTLLMALLNKDQLKFHSYQDAKFLVEAIEKRYGGNKESKKVQRTLLKQQFENFAASSSETLDQTFDSTNSTSNTNEVDNTAYGVSTAHTQGNTVNSTSVDNLSDAVICTFLASQPKSPQLARQDLEQIDLDDLEEMDLHWEMAMLTITAQSADSEVDSCSRTCIKAYATLKEQYDSLSSDYKKSQFNLVSYKVENQVSEKVKSGIGYKAASPVVESFVNSSEMLRNQENVKSKSYKGYHATPPPYTWNYIPPKPDLTFIDEQVESDTVDIISNIASSDVKTFESKRNEYTKRDKIQAKSSTKRKAWKSEKSKVNKKSNPTKSKPREIKKLKEINFSLILAAVNMSLTDINASLTEHNLHHQCKLFSRVGNSLAVGTHHWKWEKCTRSGNGLEHLIPNNPPQNLILHLQSSFWN
nr:ribonuclease H-like domain-containing protein [Tanacetum cinerariifolium]